MASALLGLNPLQWLFLCITIGILLTGLRGIRIVDRAYGEVLTDLEQVRQSGCGAAAHLAIQEMLHAYEQAVQRKQSLANVGALVDRALGRLRPGGQSVTGWVRIVRTAISICVLMGLLGTFIGLIAALFGLGGSLGEAARQSGSSGDIAALLGQLRGLLGGMSTAFLASFLGVLGSAVLTATAAVKGTFTLGERTASELEHFLCNEYMPTAQEARTADIYQRLLERFDLLATRLEQGLTSTLAGAAQHFGESARQLGEVLAQVEPITRGLGSSGETLASMGQSMAAVTTEMREVVAAMKENHELLPRRLAELRTVEETLVAAISPLQEGLVASTRNANRLVDAIDLFQNGARDLESGLAGFRQQWPTIIAEFASRTEQAVEQQALTVSESLERLRELLAQERQESLTQLEALVSTNHATAQAVAAALLSPGQAARRPG